VSSLNSIARGQNEVNVESHLVALTPDLFYTGGKKTIVLSAVQKGKKSMPRRSNNLPRNRVRMPGLDVQVPSTPISPEERPTTSRSRLISGIAGGILFAAGVAWLAWLLTHQNARPVVPVFPTPGLAPTHSPAVQVSPLLAAGITLGKPLQPSALNQQQALLIASELEPDAAVNAKNTTTQYVLLNYTNRSTPAVHPDLTDYPAWMILYQNIPLQPGDASVDSTPFPQSHHDLYVFLDANNGKELLAIWV